jgi:hypothetical protein
MYEGSQSEFYYHGQIEYGDKEIMMCEIQTESLMNSVKCLQGNQF